MTLQAETLQRLFKKKGDSPATTHSPQSLEVRPRQVLSGTLRYFGDGGSASVTMALWAVNENGAVT